MLLYGSGSIYHYSRVDISPIMDHTARVELTLTILDRARAIQANHSAEPVLNPIVPQARLASLAKPFSQGSSASLY